MAIVSRFASTALDCPDPAALLGFYRRLTGWQVVYESADFAALSPDGSRYHRIDFQRVEDYRAPDWPGQDRPQQLHLDFFAADLDAAQRGAEQIGARVAQVQPQPDKWRVMLDPAGHPFCLCVEPDFEAET